VGAKLVRFFAQPGRWPAKAFLDRTGSPPGVHRGTQQELRGKTQPKLNGAVSSGFDLASQPEKWLLLKPLSAVKTSSTSWSHSRRSQLNAGLERRPIARGERVVSTPRKMAATSGSTPTPPPFAMSLSSRGSLARAHSREASVLVPLDLDDVITGLRDKAKQGNAQAATALLGYLTRFPVQQGDGADWMDTRLEDMTPDQLAFAEAYATRRINRAMRRMEGMRQAGSTPPG